MWREDEGKKSDSGGVGAKLPRTASARKRWASIASPPFIIGKYIATAMGNDLSLMIRSIDMPYQTT